MPSTANNPEEYIETLPEDRKFAIGEIRKVLLENLPRGFTEIMGNGMLSYVVPHSLYPNGYHCNPKQPLPFISLASHKNFIAMYHMGLYANQKLLQWFTTEFPKHSKVKLDMGKSCIRFKKPEQIPFKLIGELVGKIAPSEWIACYEDQFKRR